MAYTYDNINNVLDQNNQNNQNIFSQGSSSNPGQGSQPSPGQTQGTTNNVTVAPQTGGQTVNVKDTSPQSAQKSGKAVLQKAGIGQDTSFTNKITGQIKEAGNQLQNEANQYVSAQGQKQAKALSNEELERGASGDQGAYKNIENLLRGPGERADEFRSGVSSRFNDVDQISTQGGLQSYLQKRGSDTYNQGQAALDALLFSRDKGFQEGAKQAKTERDLLKQNQLGLESTLQGQEQAKLDAAREAAKASATGYLSSQQSALRDALAQRANAINAERSRIGASGNAELTKARSEEALAQLIRENPNLNNEFIQMAAKNVSANPYLRANGQIAATDTANAQEASRYNRIMDLLGTGGQRLSASNVGESANFDTSGYKQALLNEIAKLRRPVANSAPGGTLYTTGQGGFVGDLTMDEYNKLKNKDYSTLANPGSIGTSAVKKKLF